MYWMSKWFEEGVGSYRVGGLPDLVCVWNSIGICEVRNGGTRHLTGDGCLGGGDGEEDPWLMSGGGGAGGGTCRGRVKFAREAGVHDVGVVDLDGGWAGGVHDS